jgi:hypothetical protein
MIPESPGRGSSGEGPKRAPRSTAAEAKNSTSPAAPVSRAASQPSGGVDPGGGQHSGLGIVRRAGESFGRAKLLLSRLPIPRRSTRNSAALGSIHRASRFSAAYFRFGWNAWVLGPITRPRKGCRNSGFFQLGGRREDGQEAVIRCCHRADWCDGRPDAGGDGGRRRGRERTAQRVGLHAADCGRRSFAP